MTETAWRFDGHPNSTEIALLRDRVPRLGGLELSQLATSWHESADRERARHVALGPETPGVADLLSTLACIDELSAVAEELRLLPWATAGLLPAVLTDLAFRAVADVATAAYARPVLGAAHYALLSAPWRALHAA